ncbi:hypothetical protein Y023_5923 [Burkholderia pseudomallei A79D]|nr:hypothetical protein Y023_5923 [Burkholderia pseudomallei A79D]KGX94656.1 hypothetical protein X997_5771 [Burkholderia pseudomallei A79C]
MTRRWAPPAHVHARWHDGAQSSRFARRIDERKLTTTGCKKLREGTARNC